jgi:LysM repeat protein
MRQVKRLVYMVLLNVLISAVTVFAVLKWWETRHPTNPAVNTPVVIVVTPTQSVNLPLMANNTGLAAIDATDEGVQDTTINKATPTIGMLNYQVKEGDILGALAVQFNVSIADIMAVNGISDPDSLYVGQIILIPTAPLPTVTFTAPPPTEESSPTPKPTATVTPTPTLTPTPTQVGQGSQVRIEKVVGEGNLETERVQLQYSGNGELSLAGWRIDDGQGQVYIFPQLTLYQGGAINLNTRSGQDTVVDLYWDLTTPLWQAGKTAYLYNSLNELQSTYKIP